MSSDLCSYLFHLPFVIYVVCEQLPNGMGNALIGTVSQVSLGTEIGLARGSKINWCVLRIRGVPGNVNETQGQINMCIGETSPRGFVVVENLTLNCEILLGYK